MNHFPTACASIVRQKMTVVLAVLALLGLIGSVTTFVQSAPSAYAASHTAVRAASGCFFYTVKHGDTLRHIAATHNSSVSVIARANRIPNVNLIYPGQRFCIPASRVTDPPVNKGTTSGTGTSVPVSMGQSNSVANMIYQVFGPYGAGAVRVAACESGLNPGAYNPISIGGSHAAGVFQILYPSTWAGTPEAASSPYNAWANIQAAHAIFVRDGYSWREWTCKP